MRIFPEKRWGENMSNEQEQSADIVRSCAISNDLESYPLLIQEMQVEFAESWGGLDLDDAIAVLNSSHADHMESLVMAIGASDEQHIDLIIEIVSLATSKNLRTVLVTRDLSASALHSLMRSGADDFVPYPLPDGALAAAMSPVEFEHVAATPRVDTKELPVDVEASAEATDSEVKEKTDSVGANEESQTTHNFTQPQRAETEVSPEPKAEPEAVSITKPEIETDVSKAASYAPSDTPIDFAPPQKEAPKEIPTEQPVAQPQSTPEVSQTAKTGVVFPVIGMAGGVGASTFAANLAWEMQSVLGKDARVCILDFGFQFGSVGTYLDTPRTEMTMELFSSIDFADADAFTQSLSMYKDAVAVLAAPPEAVPLEIMAPHQIDRLIDLAAAQFDYVIIDLPNTLASWSETVLERAHLMFALLEMDMRSAQNALRFLRALKADDLPYEKVQFILNKAPKMTDLNGKSRVKRMADSLNIEFRWSLPDGGKHVVNACDQGLPLAITSARNPLRKDLRKISENLIALAQDDAKVKARA
jgi:Flp pilus assembly CpaE family ATPase/DNA-binding NarL/FixJ family response regulator